MHEYNEKKNMWDILFKKIEDFFYGSYLGSSISYLPINHLSHLHFTCLEHNFQARINENRRTSSGI